MKNPKGVVSNLLEGGRMHETTGRRLISSGFQVASLKPRKETS